MLPKFLYRAMVSILLITFFTILVIALSGVNKISSQKIYTKKKIDPIIHVVSNNGKNDTTYIYVKPNI